MNELRNLIAKKETLLDFAERLGRQLDEAGITYGDLMAALAWQLQNECNYDADYYLNDIAKEARGVIKHFRHIDDDEERADMEDYFASRESFDDYHAYRGAA